MTRTLLAFFIATPILVITGIHSAVAQLDAATRTQCAQQQWPVHQHAAHLEFCRTYLATR